MDGSPLTGSAGGGGSPLCGSCHDTYPWEFADVVNDLSNIHAANATCAAMQAEVAAKHAASLAQWVQHLWGQVAQLQGKIGDLENWKTKTLSEMNMLRLEHKALRRKVTPDDDELHDDPVLPSKSKSLPLMLVDHVDPDVNLDKKGKDTKPAGAAGLPLGPPPGLGSIIETSGALEKSKSVRFEPRAVSQPVSPVDDPSSGDSQPSIAERSLSTLSQASNVTDVAEECFFEGVNVTPGVVDGIPAAIAQWRIAHVSTKLRSCMGRSLVSSPFCMMGLEDLRLMVFADARDAIKGPRSRRQKELYAQKVTKGPLEGCLKLKVPDCPPPHILVYYLRVGSCRQGPFEHNFAETTVNGCLDFGVDWLRELEPDQSLTVTLELLHRGTVAEAEPRNT